MADMDRPSRTWTWGAVAGLLTLALLAVWLLASHAESSAPEATRAPAPVATAPPEDRDPAPVNPMPASATRPAAPPVEEAVPPPIIDEVRVEKSEVCSGEDNLISVRAHSPDGDDSHLHGTIGTGTGMRVPLRVWLNPDGTYEPPMVTVFGKNNVPTSVPVPKYTVKPCEPDRIVEVFSRRLPNAEDDYEFLARVIEIPKRDEKAPRKPFTPVKFVWTFDDTQTVTTTVPVVSHTLTTDGTRPWAQFFQHLVRVDVLDAAGRAVTGRSSLQLLNTSFENFDKKGIVTVLGVGTPRFPELGADGVVRQTFRLYHHWKGVVRLEKVTALRAFTPTEAAPPLPEQVDEVSLGVTAIPEGRGTEVQVTLDTKSEPDVFAITYVLEGTSADGHPARGTFSVMRPPPRPTKDNNVPVTDPVLVAKIKRARELLQQEFVTDEDIWRLEREGRLKDLQVQR